MEPKRALLISWDIEEYDSITCFAIKALVADLIFWPKLVGSAAAMVKKCARNTKFYVCPDLIRLLKIDKINQYFKNTQYFTSSISNAQNKTHTINVPAGTKQVKVMVYWTDKEVDFQTKSGQ